MTNECEANFYEQSAVNDEMIVAECHIFDNLWILLKTFLFVCVFIL